MNAPCIAGNEACHELQDRYHLHTNRQLMIVQASFDANKTDRRGARQRYETFFVPTTSTEVADGNAICFVMLSKLINRVLRVNPLLTTPFTDDDGFFVAPPGASVIDYDSRQRYEIISCKQRTPANTVFACVQSCVRGTTGPRYTALKVSRARQITNQRLLNEIYVINRVSRAFGRRSKVAAFTGAFMFDEHVCVSLDLVSLSLEQVTKARFRTHHHFSTIAHVAAQLLVALCQVRSSAGFIHSGLCPANIHSLNFQVAARAATTHVDMDYLLCFMFMSLEYDDDLPPNTVDGRQGIWKSHMDAAYNTIYRVGTSLPVLLSNLETCRLEHAQPPLRRRDYAIDMHYEPPCELLGLPASAKGDVWAVGCVVCELSVGRRMFAGDTEGEVLGSMVSALGMPPASLLDRAPRSLEFFEKGADGQWSIKKEFEKPPHRCAFSLVFQSVFDCRCEGVLFFSVLQGDKCRKLFPALNVQELVSVQRRVDNAREALRSDMLEFLRLAFTWDPAERCSVETLLKHPFIRDGLITEAVSRAAAEVAASRPTPTDEPVYLSGVLSQWKASKNWDYIERELPYVHLLPSVKDILARASAMFRVDEETHANYRAGGNFEAACRLNEDFALRNLRRRSFGEPTHTLRDVDDVVAGQREVFARRNSDSDSIAGRSRRTKMYNEINETFDTLFKTIFFEGFTTSVDDEQYYPSSLFKDIRLLGHTLHADMIRRLWCPPE